MAYINDRRVGGNLFCLRQVLRDRQMAEGGREVKGPAGRVVPRVGHLLPPGLRKVGHEGEVPAPGGVLERRPWFC